VRSRAWPAKREQAGIDTPTLNPHSGEPRTPERINGRARPNRDKTDVTLSNRSCTLLVAALLACGSAAAQFKSPDDAIEYR
jgi:hypothetical protein